MGGSAERAPHGANKVAKKKIWEKVQPELRTNDAREATFGGGARLVSVAGAVTCASLKGGGISRRRRDDAFY